MNLKTEIMLEEMHEKLDSLLTRQNTLIRKVNELESKSAESRAPKDQK